jgi:hypothetical protein
MPAYGQTRPSVDPDKPSAVFWPVRSHGHFQSRTDLPTSPELLPPLSPARGAGRSSRGNRELLCCPVDLVDGAIEGNLVCLGRPVKPLSLRTNWREDALISSSVAGGLKLWSVLIARHMAILDYVPHDLSILNSVHLCSERKERVVSPGARPALMRQAGIRRRISRASPDERGSRNQIFNEPSMQVTACPPSQIVPSSNSIATRPSLPTQRP